MAAAAPSSAGHRRLLVNMVCTGNICRSPTAHAVLEHKLRAAGLDAHVAVTSSGTHGHTGWSADDRSAAAAAARGYDLGSHRARRLTAADYTECTLLVALDSGHLEYMVRAAPAQRHKMVLLNAFADLALADRSCDFAAAEAAAPASASERGSSRRQRLPADVPDPYYEDLAAFETVLDMVDAATDGLVEALRDAVYGPGDAAAGKLGSSGTATQGGKAATAADDPATILHEIVAALQRDT
jgi:protein-tyrosine phosphatase